MTDNMKLWNMVEETDPSTTKEVGYGRKYTAIDAYSQIKRATEIWGPYGAWGLTNITYTPVDNTNIMLVSAVFKCPECEFPISSSIFHTSEKGKQDDEFAKKVETDLITKSLSRIGFNADVFMGKFDDNRYVQEMKKKFDPSTPPVVIGEMSGEPVDMVKVNKAATWAKKVIDKDDLLQGSVLIQEKWKLLTNDEKMQAGGLLKDKAPGTKKMYGTLLTEYLNFTPTEGVPE